MTRRIYFFGQSAADGDPKRVDVLGGKGASLAAMSLAGLPVPPGFTISTECCKEFLASGGRWPDGLEAEVRANLAKLEAATARRFGRPGDPQPLLVSVRSGAAISMPGMMDTILNCGLLPEFPFVECGSEATALADSKRPPATKAVAALPHSTNSEEFPFVECGSEATALADSKRPPVTTAGTALPHSTNNEDAPGAGRSRVYSQFAAMFQRVAGRTPPADPFAALAACIETVFRSWNSPRAVAYRQSHDIRDLAGTAVTVQAMFPSQVSGVAFTTNPTTGDANEIIIEASFGLGEAIVSGDVHPDSFVVDKASLSADAGVLPRLAAGPKVRACTPAEPAGVVESPIKQRSIGHKSHVVLALGESPPADPDAPCLTDAQIVELATIAVQVESFFGKAMDIEWGLAGGKFALLQARPVRVGKGTDAQEEMLAATRDELRAALSAGHGPWVLHNLAETLPHPTPLTWSVMRRFMSGAGGFGAMYRQAGFEPSEQACRDGFLTLIAGRIYMDTEAAPGMFFADFPFRYDAELLRVSPAAADGPPSEPAGSLLARVRARRRVKRSNAKLAAMSADFDKKLSGEVIPAFVAWCREQKAIDLTKLSGQELATLWRERERRVLDEFAPQSLLPSLIGEMALAKLRDFLAEVFWNVDVDELAAQLVAPRQPDRTVQANAELFAVSAGKQTTEQWVIEHGHRAVEEFDLASPRWRERPGELAAMADQLRGGADPGVLWVLRHRKTAERLDRLCERLSPRVRRELDARADLARRYLAFRENGKYYLMLGYDLLRDAALEAGRRLGIGDDVFLLTRDEMLAGIEFPFVECGSEATAVESGRSIQSPKAGAALPHSTKSEEDSRGEFPFVECGSALSPPLGGRVRERGRAEGESSSPVGNQPPRVGPSPRPSPQGEGERSPSLPDRRAAHRATARVSLPRLIDADVIDTLGRPVIAEGAPRYEAVALSAGSASGPARIVRSPADAVNLGRGYILVCTSTDPAWTPLFVNAAGLVLECGGVLSHGALVAREMGIPAVVLSGATDLIAPGETITIDGSGGAVCRGAEACCGETDAGMSNADVRVPRRHTPPVPGRRERASARIRNIALAAWGLFLLAAFLTPEQWLYQPTMSLLDWLLWPAVRSLGGPATVAIVAAAMAVLTMLGQRLLTDNGRIREARRRANWLTKRAGQLPPDSPRRHAIGRLASPVNLRVFAAAMTPLAVLLGPMVFAFAWLAARVAPETISPPPGTAVTVVADVDADFAGPVTLTVSSPLTIDPATPPTQTLTPIRPTLEKLLADWTGRTPATQPAISPEELKLSQPEAVGHLRAYLADPSPRPIAWTVRSSGAAGRFDVIASCGGEALTASIVLGDNCAPAAAEVAGPDGSHVRAVRIVPPPGEQKRVFWSPLAGWDIGWLLTYLIVYLPLMFLVKWALRVA
ncbi:MAG: PEP/pyruvate-binding domain-containing protein [Phycisphaerae bacterium]|nr:PEP/pyruvate-binding domain-containing protein [Phycisphaerae bacterium]